MRKVIEKVKQMDLRCQIPLVCWELFFLMLCMLLMDKGSSINLDLMLLSNYVVIMIIMMSIYVYMYACMSLSDRVVKDHNFFMLVFLYKYVSMYLCHYLTGLLRIILVEERFLMQVNGVKRFLVL